jgi:hypothetical protein
MLSGCRSLDSAAHESGRRVSRQIDAWQPNFRLARQRGAIQAEALFRWRQTVNWTVVQGVGLNQCMPPPESGRVRTCMERHSKPESCSANCAEVIGISLAVRVGEGVGPRIVGRYAPRSTLKGPTSASAITP